MRSSSLRLVTSALAALLVAGPVLAHDFWILPNPFWVAPGGVTAASMQVGHGQDNERWNVDVRRVLMLRSVGPGGAVADRLAEVRASGLGRDTPLRFAAPGTHLLAMESTHAVSELPAIRFNDYLALEGLTPAQIQRQRTRTTDRGGREIYSRRAKALIQVGPYSAAGQAHVTRPLGLTLEIVPESNPYGLRAGQPLAVRIYYQGRLQPGALVKFYDLSADAEPVATVRSDAQGRAVFRMPARGSWLINVIWTRPITGDPRGDFDTTFSSLSFGLPPARQ